MGRYDEHESMLLYALKLYEKNDLVFLVQQRNGKFRVLGSQEFETLVKPTTALGQGVTGTAGTTLEIEATDVCPAPFYPGKIETEDGDIKGSDGSAWDAE